MRTFQLVCTSALLLVALGSSGCNLVLDLGGFTDETSPGAGGSGATGTGGIPDQGGGGSNQGAGGSESVGGQGGMAGPGGAGGVGGIGGEGGEGGEGGSPPVCDGSTHVCVESPPAEWTGPVALYTGPGGDAAPPCDGTYPNAIGDYNAGLVPGAAVCDCSCSAAQGIQCTSPTSICYNSNCSLACFSSNATIPPDGATCSPVPSSTSSNARVSNPAPTNMGTCASASNHTLPTPVWDTTARACGGAVSTPLGCDGGELCAPLTVGSADKMCIVHAGDVACPAGSTYTEQHVLYDGFTDTRSCSSCGCGGAVSVCGGSVTFTSSSCMIAEAVVNAGSCGPKGAASGAYYDPSPSGMCPTVGGTLSGEATETGAVTYCCQP